MLAEGTIGIRWYWSGWCRVIWQQGSSKELDLYHECCELLPGGWEPEKDQFKSVDGIAKQVRHSSYAALLDPKCYAEGADVTFLLTFLEDYARGVRGWAPRKPWKEMPKQSPAIASQTAINPRSWFAWFWRLFSGSSGTNSRK
jgi:hypothetical protein